jgi:hypothetical protein
MDFPQHITGEDAYDELDIMDLVLHSPLKATSQRLPHALSDPGTREKSHKRPRTKSILATQSNSERAVVKKQKVEDKKAVRIVTMYDFDA